MSFHRDSRFSATSGLSRAQRIREKANRWAARIHERAVAYQTAQAERVRRFKKYFPTFLPLNISKFPAFFAKFPSLFMSMFAYFSGAFSRGRTIRSRAHARAGMIKWGGGKKRFPKPTKSNRKSTNRKLAAEGLEVRSLLAADIDAITPGTYLTDPAGAALDTAVTNVQLPTISGTAAANSTVSIDLNNNGVFNVPQDTTVTADALGNWTYTFTANIGASKTIRVVEGALGNGATITADDQLQITRETTAPTLSYPGIPVSTNSSSLTLQLQFTEVVTGLLLTDFTVTAGAALSNLTGSGSTYSIDIAFTTEGQKTITLLANSVLDQAGNANAADIQNIRFDITPPSFTGLNNLGPTLR